MTFVGFEEAVHFIHGLLMEHLGLVEEHNERRAREARQLWLE